MIRRPPSFEMTLREFRTGRGLYITGAGTSVGDTPRGRALMTAPARAFLAGGSFPVQIPQHSHLTRVLVQKGMTITAEEFTGREQRPGTADFPIQELVVRLNNGYAHGQMQNLLAKSNHERRVSANYAVFRSFRSGLIANYNLDGLASAICGDIHKVIAMHGSVPRGWGGPEMAKWLEAARDYDIPTALHELLMCVRERSDDARLYRKLMRMARFNPEFIAVIGYSFGRGNGGLDDQVSADFFARIFRRYTGSIYVIDPDPEPVADMIAREWKAGRVYRINAYWNALARAIVKRPFGAGRSLNYNHEASLDRDGSEISYLMQDRD